MSTTITSTTTIPQAGPDLWDLHGRARPQRPAEGWSFVVHDTSRRWRGKRERARAAQQQGQQGQQQGQPGEGGPAPYAAGPDGVPRALSPDEAYLERRRAPKARRRWFAHNRRLGTG